MNGSGQTTTTTLLKGLFDAQNHAVWQEFHTRYYPIILSVARRLGMAEEDAADVAQETLTKFLLEYRDGKYDRERGRLRSWIIGIAKYRVADINRAKARQRMRRGLSAIENLPGDNEMEQLWEEECRQEILRQAMSRLKGETRFDARTIRAFEELTLQQKPPAQVALEQGMSVDAVYKAKQRCLDQLKLIIAELNGVYEAHL